MVEERDLFGPFITKKLQQEYARMQNRGLDMTSPKLKFLEDSQEYRLSPEQEKSFISRATKELGNSNVSIKRVIAAGSLGIVFELKDGRVLKWIPSEVQSKLEKERLQYTLMRDNASSQGEKRKAEILIEEIDEFIAELDLQEEVAKGESMKASYEATIVGDGWVEGKIKVAAPEVLGESKAFNIQSRAQGRSLRDYNSPKSWQSTQPWERIQVQDSMRHLLDKHMQAIFTGQDFHADLHAGNIYIKAVEGERLAATVTLIDAGTTARLDEPDLWAIKNLFRIRNEITAQRAELQKYYQGNGRQPPIAIEIEKSMRPLSNTGANFQVFKDNGQDMMAFLDIFSKGKPIASADSLRMLDLRPEVVQAFKSVSTAVSVLNASNKSAHAFNQTIGDGTKASIIERKKPEDLFEYLSRVIDNSVDLSIRDRRTDALGRVNQNIQERRNDAIEADRLGNNAQAVMSGPRISESGVRTESDSGSARATVDAGVGSDVQKFQRNSVRETGTGSMMMPERESRASGRERFFSEQVQTSTQGIGRSQANSSQT